MGKQLFAIQVGSEARAELGNLKVFDARRVVDAMEASLLFDPVTESRNRKPLHEGLEVNFEYVPPLWELRVGDIRVFYDVNVSTHSVYIRAIRKKSQGKTTQEITK